jgi:peptide/nickel transport system substrate-binding protein
MSTKLMASSLALVALATAGCGSEKKKTAVGDRPIVISMSGGLAEPATIDPQANYDYGGLIIPNMYDKLVKQEGDKSSHVEPQLATAWKTSGDGLTWTFTLRSGATFHDGEPVNAAAVKFSFDRMFKMNLAGTGNFRMIKSVATPDDRTVVFRLKYAFPGLLNALTSAANPSIVSPKTVKAHEVGSDLGQKWLGQHEAGSGPYRLKQWNRGQRMVLTPYKGYWGGWKGRAQRDVSFEFPTSSSTARLGLQNGDVDGAVGLTPQDFDALQGVQGVKVTDYKASGIRYLSFNTKHGPTSNKLVRQALAYAFDAQSMVDAVFKGRAKIAKSIAPEGVPGYVSPPNTYTYNLSKAKSLLEQAGVAKGLKIEAYAFPGDDQGLQILQIWKDALSKIGVNLVVGKMDYAEFTKALDSPSTTPDVIQNQWGLDYADDTWMYWQFLYSGTPQANGRWSHYKNSEVDALMEQARAKGNDLGLYRQALQVAYDDMPVLPVFQTEERIALRSNVTGYRYNLVFSGYYWEPYYMDRSGQ